MLHTIDEKQSTLSVCTSHALLKFVFDVTLTHKKNSGHSIDSSVFSRRVLKPALGVIDSPQSSAF